MGFLEESHGFNIHKLLNNMDKGLKKGHQHTVIVETSVHSSVAICLHFGNVRMYVNVSLKYMTELSAILVLSMVYE